MRAFGVVAPRPSRPRRPARPWLPRDPVSRPPRPGAPQADWPLRGVSSPAGSQARASRGRAASRAPSRALLGMDPQAAGAQALGAAGPPRGPPLPSARKAPPSPGVSAAPGPVAAGAGSCGARWVGPGGGCGAGQRGPPAIAERRLGARWSWKRPGRWAWVGAPGAKLSDPGRLCVLAKWEGMLVTETGGRCRGLGPGPGEGSEERDSSRWTRVHGVDAQPCLSTR